MSGVLNMPGFFMSLNRPTINYVKMYSTFRENTSPYCLAFILQPCVPEKRLLALGSIQFDFNAEGHVRALRIFYEGDKIQRHKKAQKTIKAFDVLNVKFGHHIEKDCAFNVNKESLILDLRWAKGATAYLGAVVDLLTEHYCIKDDFALEIKKQIRDQDYLAKEFKRLHPLPMLPYEPKHEEPAHCVLM